MSDLSPVGANGLACVPGVLERAVLNARMKELLVEVLEVSIAPSQLSDEEVIFEGELDADSIMALEILTSVEDRFGIVFEDSDVTMRMLQTVSTLVEAVHAKLTAQSSPQPFSEHHPPPEVP